MASDPDWSSVTKKLKNCNTPSRIVSTVNEDGDPGSRRPSTTSQIVNSKTNRNFTFHTISATFKSFVMFASRSEDLFRGDLDYSKDKIGKTIGLAAPKQFGQLDQTLAFRFPKHAHDKLEALADDRGERVATTARKIIEYKIAKDPSIIREAENIKIAIKISQELRDRIDELIEGTGMKRTEFLALQLHSFIEEISLEPPEA